MTDLAIIDVADQAKYDQWVEELKDPSIRFALSIKRFPKLRKGALFLLRCERSGRVEGGHVVDERQGEGGVLYALLERDPNAAKAFMETQ